MGKNEKEAKKAEAKKEQTAQAAEELLNQLQRLQAEFDNYQKRTAKEKEEYKAWVSATIVSELLPIVDNFELALKNAPETERTQFYKGVEMIYAQLHEQIEKLGVTEIEATGQFNPTKHEVLLTEERKGVEKNTIIEILQKGYEINGKIIRAAKVKVAK